MERMTNKPAEMSTIEYNGEIIPIIETKYHLYMADNEGEVLVLQNLPNKEIRLNGQPISDIELIKKLRSLNNGQ
jgi:hypothetical protein